MPHISLEMAIKLFKWKMTSVKTYALELVWHHLTENVIKITEKVKATF
jgi:hypothetical protein